MLHYSSVLLNSLFPIHSVPPPFFLAHITSLHAFSISSILPYVSACYYNYYTNNTAGKSETISSKATSYFELLVTADAMCRNGFPVEQILHHNKSDSNPRYRLLGVVKYHPTIFQARIDPRTRVMTQNNLILVKIPFRLAGLEPESQITSIETHRRAPIIFIPYQH